MTDKRAISIAWPKLVAVASEGLDVSRRNGYCTNYNYYRIADGRINDSQNLPAKGLVNEKYAKIFEELGVDVVIVSDIGETACRSFTDRGIAIARGASGRAIDAAQDFLDGKLEVSEPTNRRPHATSASL
ncbi:MAG: NifB/NifX family molybdenum-iron cluster-binding protein [Eggerthellaceae bacterium]